MGALGQPIDVRRQARVMLVEDSAVVRGMVRNWLGALRGIEIVATAANGQIALNHVAEAKPDIIILDIEMPVMDGMTALPGLLRAAPNAKVLLASTLSLRNAEITLKAMALGAADYVAKPSFARDGNEARDLFRQELLRKVEGLAEANLSKDRPVVRSQASGAWIGSGANTGSPSHTASRTISRLWAPIPAADSVFNMRPISRVVPRVLVVGASTGGPAALSILFENMKDRLTGVPVLVAQHMPPTFTALLADKLCRMAGLEGGEAKQGEPVVPGRLYLAPGGYHMRLVQVGNEVRIKLDEGPPINHCRPAVDPLFESVGRIYKNAALGVVLTGMGADGSQGALRIADGGGTIFAQDEPSSVVWGMPGATAGVGACAKIIPLNAMAREVIKLLHKGTKK